MSQIYVYYSLLEVALISFGTLLFIFLVCYFLFKPLKKGTIVTGVLFWLFLIVLTIIFGYRKVTASSENKAFLYHDSTIVKLVDFTVITNLNSLQFSYGSKTLNYFINIPAEFSEYLSHSRAAVEVIYNYDDEKLLIKECQRMLNNNPNKKGDYSLDTLFAKVISSVKNWRPYEEPKIVSIEYYYKQYLSSYLSGTGIKIKGVNLLYLDPPTPRGPHQD